MPKLYLRDASAFRLVKKLYLRDASAFRLVKKLYMKDGSTWRLVFSGATLKNPLNYAVETSVISPDEATVFLRFAADGGTVSSTGVEDNWLAPTQVGVGAAYWFKFTIASGPTPIGMTAGTWYNLSAAWDLTLQQSGIGVKSGSYNVYIATAGNDSAIVTSGTVNLQASVEI